MTMTETFDREAWLATHGAREPREGGWVGPLARDKDGARFTWCSVVSDYELVDGKLEWRRATITSSPGGDENYRGWTVKKGSDGWIVRDPSGIPWTFTSHEVNEGNPWANSPGGQRFVTASGSLVEPH